MLALSSLEVVWSIPPPSHMKRKDIVFLIHASSLSLRVDLNHFNFLLSHNKILTQDTIDPLKENLGAATDLRGCDTPSNIIDILMHCQVTPNNSYLTVYLWNLCYWQRKLSLFLYATHHNVHTLWVVCRLMISTQTTSLTNLFFMGW